MTSERDRRHHFAAPRSACNASGTAHRSCDTWAMKATAPSEAFDMWNEVSRLRPTRAMPLPNVPGTSAAAVEENERGVARFVQYADERRRLALPRAGHDRQVRHHVGVLQVGHRLLQQVVRNGEVEQRLVGH